MSFTTKSGGRLVIAGATGIQPVTGVRQRRLVLQEPQGSSPQEQIQPGTRKVQRGGTVYVSTPARQTRGVASCQHASTISVAQGGSVHRGVSTPVRKHELARQYAVRLPAHRIRQTLCGVPPATQARPQHFKMSFELQVSQASSTEAILGLGGCWVTTTIRKSACATSSAHRGLATRFRFPSRHRQE